MKSHTVIPSLVSFPFLCQFLMILHHYCYFFLSIIPTIMVYFNLIFFTQMLLESKCMLLWWSNVSKPLCISRIVLISQFIYPRQCYNIQKNVSWVVCVLFISQSGYYLHPIELFGWYLCMSVIPWCIIVL